MAFPAFAELYRLGTSQSLALASGAGAAVSCAAFGTETWAIRMAFPGSVSSTGGVKVSIIDTTSATAVTSLTGTLLVANWVEEVLVRPGQKVSAISADAGTPTLNITELTK